MATSPAATITTIFMILIPLCWAPGRADRVTPLFAPLASSSRAAPPLHSQSFADHGAARYDILNKALTAIRRETEFPIQVMGRARRTSRLRSQARDHGHCSHS